MGKFTINILLSITFLLAGFSQLEMPFLKPVYPVMITLLLILLCKGYLKIGITFLFFIYSTIYAFTIGGASKPAVFFSLIFTFMLLFSLIELFYRTHKEQLYRYLSIFNVSMFLSNVLALLIFIKVPSLRDYVVDASNFGFRFKGFFNQSNGYAFVLLVNFPLSIFIYVQKKNIMNLAAVFTCFSALLFTQSRGAISGIGLASVVVFMFYLTYANIGLFLKKSILPLLVGVTSFLLIISFAPQYLEKEFGLNLTRLNPINENISERNMANLSYEDLERDRFYLVASAYRTLIHHPFGLGFQDQHEVIGDYTGIYRIPHNFFLSLFLTYGIIFGFLWNTFIVYLLFKGFAYMRNNNISPKNFFFYLHIMIVSISFYYLTHSPEWIYFHIFLAIYCSFIFRPAGATLLMNDLSGK